MQKNKLSLFIVLLVLTLISGACRPVQPVEGVSSSVPTTTGLKQSVIAAIEQAVKQTMAETHAPGVAVGIVKDGKVVYMQGFGVMELGKQPVTPQSVFLWASVSKTVTAIAIMQLVEQGKIDLDAPLTKYLPYFRMADERYKGITIRQLLSHMAGIYDLPPEKQGDFYRNPADDEEARERYVRSLSDMKLLAAPGQQWAYSTPGFMILADVVAKVSGQAYEIYVQEHILTPLGMKHATFFLKEVPPNLLVSPHVVDGAGNVIVSPVYPYSRPFAGGSGLLASVEDMTRYALANLNRGELDGVRILSAASYDQMWQPVAKTDIPDPAASQYGLGWMIGEHQGEQTVGHDGLIKQFNAFLTLVPDKKMGVVLVVNYTDYDKFVFPAFLLRVPILDDLLSEQR